MKNEAVIVKMTNGVALGGLTLQAWWPSLMQISQIAGALVPILSALWLSLQIFKFFFMQKGKPHE